MEFVGNQINFKTVSATLAVAFFIGRIEIFGGIYPAAIALIVVMLAVSTLYIYLVPVVCISIIMGASGGVTAYGDIVSAVLCGLLFLFFHNQRLSVNQRTLIAIAITVICRCGCYLITAAADTADWTVIVEEIIALAIYIRVFNTVAQLIFAPKEVDGLSGEKIRLSLAILIISMVGALGIKPVVFAFWFLIIIVFAYCREVSGALVLAAICDLFWFCSTGTSSPVFTSLFLGLVVARFLVAATEIKYRKHVLAITVFAGIVLTTRTFDYSIAVSTAVFIAVPSEILKAMWIAIEGNLFPDAEPKTDAGALDFRRDLRKKRDTFRSLGKIYEKGSSSGHIISYQFEAMARATDRYLDWIRRGEVKGRTHPSKSIEVGSATYSSGQISGDSSLCFSFDGNRQGLIISDGMGKGEEAAPTSQMVVYTLSKLLKAGFDVDLALKTINEILMLESSSQMFASLDLAIINKENRRAQVFKMGAATTFVKHGEQVAMLKKSTPPIGVATPIKLEYLDVKLSTGDVLVMVSDGVCDCDRSDIDCRWLTERLANMGSRDPNVIAELIINKAVEKYGIKERDDLTVLVAVV